GRGHIHTAVGRARLTIKYTLTAEDTTDASAGRPDERLLESLKLTHPLPGGTGQLVLLGNPRQLCRIRVDVLVGHAGNPLDVILALLQIQLPGLHLTARRLNFQGLAQRRLACRSKHKMAFW